METNSANQQYWQLNHETREIIDSVALEYDGYLIKKFVFAGDKNACACCSQLDGDGSGWDYRLHPDRYFLRSQLFGYQRYFGKWGGERVPEWDREYSLWYFTFLQCYRARLPPIFKLKGDYGAKAVDREIAAADLRLNFSKLGKDDLRELSRDDLETAMRGDFTASCEKGLVNYISNRAMVELANASDYEIVIRMMAEENNSMEVPLRKLNFEGIFEAFSRYVNRGVTDDDDSVNGVIFKMLQWFLTTHPGHAKFTNRSYILYGLMYLHLYRIEFPRVGWITKRVNAWRRNGIEIRELWASRFREHLSVLREASSMMNGHA